jgi:hypothetical protein
MIRNLYQEIIVSVIHYENRTANRLQNLFVLVTSTTPNVKDYRSCIIQLVVIKIVGRTAWSPITQARESIPHATTNSNVKAHLTMQK